MLTGWPKRQCGRREESKVREMEYIFNLTTETTNVWKKKKSATQVIEDEEKSTIQQSLTKMIRTGWIAQDSKKKTEEKKKREHSKSNSWLRDEELERTRCQSDMTMTSGQSIFTSPTVGRTDRQTVNLTQSRPARGCYFHCCNHGNSALLGGVAVPWSSSPPARTC